MEDAALLSTPDANGAPFWHPANLEDIYSMPERTLAYFLAMRQGWTHAMNRSQGGGKQGTIGGKKVG